MRSFRALPTTGLSLILLATSVGPNAVTVTKAQLYHDVHRHDALELASQRKGEPTETAADVHRNASTGEVRGEIPYPAETYAVVNLMNEHQVTIAETTTGGREELHDPKGLLDYDALILFALQRSRTAREAIRAIAPGVQIKGYMTQMGTKQIDRSRMDWDQIDQNDFFCPDAQAAGEWEEYLQWLRKDDHNSVGAIIEVVARGVPAGIGAPVYGKLDTDLAAAMMSINAVKGVEIGDGMAAAALTGVENADEIAMGPDGPEYRSNHAGGILGGIFTATEAGVVACVYAFFVSFVVYRSIKLRDLPAVTRDGERISSSGIRACLAEADFAGAERFLGRPFRMEGHVVRGQQLGRRLGYPTANLRIRAEPSPLHGVLAVYARIAGGAWLPAVANLGRRPVVGGRNALLEVHFFDFDADIYGQRLDVQFVAKLRDEQDFDGLDALVEKMKGDEREARAILAETEPPA